MKFLLLLFSLLIGYGVYDTNKKYELLTLVNTEIKISSRISNVGWTTWNMTYEGMSENSNYFLGLIVVNNSVFNIRGIDVVLKINENVFIESCTVKENPVLNIESGHSENIYMDCLVPISREMEKSFPREAIPVDGCQYLGECSIDAKYWEVEIKSIIGSNLPMKYMVWLQTASISVIDFLIAPFKRK